jgi:YbbR domain-containing protein
MSSTISRIFIQIIALLFAIFLWFNVVTKKDYEYSLTLPISTYEFPPGLGPVTDLPESLEVKVTGMGKSLFRKDWKKAGLKVNATKLARGIGSLELTKETVDLADGERVSLMELSRTDPLIVRLDRIDTVQKPVASRLAVVPQDGYAVVSSMIAVDPRQVEMIGPRALLAEIDSIQTHSRIIDDARDDVSAMLALENSHARAVTLDPDTVSILVPVDKIDTRSFRGLPVATRRASSGSAMILDPDRVTIAVEGPQRLLDSLQNDDIKIMIDRSKVRASGYVVPDVELPELLSLTTIDPDSIRVVTSP